MRFALAVSAWDASTLLKIGCYLYIFCGVLAGMKAKLPVVCLIAPLHAFMNATQNI